MITRVGHSTTLQIGRAGLVVVFAAATLIAPGPARAAQDGTAVALVNGHPIAREELLDVLVDAYGVEVLQQLIILRVAKQETRQMGLRVTKAHVATEFQSALDRIAREAGMNPDEATEANKREALQQVLNERGISLAEFMIGMERNAHLRKIAERDLRITEETLRGEFARSFGEKAKISHIQIPINDRRALDEALNLLARGSDFADVAQKLSRNPETAARGGEMEPFTFDDPDIPPIIRERAFSLKEGAVSEPLLAGQFFHVIKLHHRIASETARFEDKRGEIEQRVRERAIPQLMAKLAVELFKKAKINVLDPGLRAKYQAFLEQDTPTGGAARP
jgi:parvulin-like peptidyl-prolyl isomerase